MRARLEGTRIGAAVLAAWGVAVGLAPHLLHHVGPLAGAALLAGMGGTLLFGALGFVLMIPFLRRLRRRFHTLIAPALATLAFAAIFAFSTAVISPLVTGGGGDTTPGAHMGHRHTR